MKLHRPSSSYLLHALTGILNKNVGNRNQLKLSWGGKKGYKDTEYLPHRTLRQNEAELQEETGAINWTVIGPSLLLTYLLHSSFSAEQLLCSSVHMVGGFWIYFFIEEIFPNPVLILSSWWTRSCTEYIAALQVRELIGGCQWGRLPQRCLLLQVGLVS